MLHEILLTLSGQPSSFSEFRAGEDNASQDAISLLPPPEKALLDYLAHLGRLHAKLRAGTSNIASSHPSVICRAVATALTSGPLCQFQDTLLEVEKAILLGDSGYVGGYGIVPLSTIVGQFTPWKQRLEWLCHLVRFIQKPHLDKKQRSVYCTGAALIDCLRAESRTGYEDIKEITVSLTTAAEMAWMRQLSVWLLYGNLPIFGKEDFFIQRDSRPEASGPEGRAHFSIRSDLMPNFVSPLTAASILFIGNSLNHMKAVRHAHLPLAGSMNSLPSSSVTLQGEHIEYLSDVKSPITALKLSAAVNAIRLSLSQTMLSKLLPLPKILEILSLLQDFLLLRRGEFAMALVSNADMRVNTMHQRMGSAQRDPSKGLEALAIKEGDTSTVLEQTWAELYSLQSEEDSDNDELHLARNLVRLLVKQRKTGHEVPSSQEIEALDAEVNISNVSFDDLLFPTPTYLSIQVPQPYDLFLSDLEISVYSKIHSYLLGIRRAQIRLSDLWKHSALRKNHPSPWGPPRSNIPIGQMRLKVGRQRDNARIIQMRPVWATASASLFVLSEIGNFFQGEVVNSSWQDFREWIERGSSFNKQSTITESSRPGTATSSSTQRQDARSTASFATSLGDRDRPPRSQQHDPETLTVAHRRYLDSLVHSLLLTHVPFTQALRSLLATTDRFIALLIRLENIQRNMDLETDEGVVDTLADYPQEEKKVWDDLRASRDELEARIKELIAQLRDVDESRSEEGRRNFDFTGDPMYNLQSKGTTMTGGNCPYTPRKAAGVDRLLMKLDF